jgi:hypothetical protein
MDHQKYERELPTIMVFRTSGVLANARPKS